MADVKKIKSWRYLHTWVCVCVYKWWALSMCLLFSQVRTCVFLLSLTTTCGIGKRRFACLFLLSLMTWLSVIRSWSPVVESLFGCERNWYSKEWRNRLIKFFVIYTFWGHLSGSKNRILLGFIAGPKIQARRHFLTNQIRIFTYFVLEPKNFLLISFWAGFSIMFLFCVFYLIGWKI